MELTIYSILVAGISLITLVPSAHAYVTGSFNLVACQGRHIKLQECSNVDAVYDIRSITVLTSADVESILNVTGNLCQKAVQCTRTIHGAEDTGLSSEYLHLYNWIQHRCNGKKTCDHNSTLPEWWKLTDDNTKCGNGQVQHFVGVLVDVQCRAGEPIVTVTAPMDTTPRTRPTTPTTTTAFPVFVPIYLPELEEREKIILAVAIALAIAILIFLLIVLYCCENYRSNKKFAKLLRMLGAPQAQEDNFDDFEDYGKSDAWKDETDANFDALGEYTGVKPNEFMTLDKKAMESSGQILYDTQMSTMTMGRGNSCSTLSRNGVMNSQPSGATASIHHGFSGTLDYETDENLELERRMAENLKEHDFEEDTSYH